MSKVKYMVGLIFFLTTLIRNIYTENFSYLQTIGKKEEPILGAIDVAIDKSKNVYILDRIAGQVKIFNAKGDFVKSIGYLLYEGGYFYNLASIAVSADGMKIYVSGGEVWMIKDEKVLSLSIISPSIWNEISGAIGYKIKIGTEGVYCLASFKQPCLFILDDDLQKIKKKIKLPDKIDDKPVSFGGMEVDKDGNIYISDTNSKTILKFDSTGKELNRFKVLGSPYGLVINKEGNVYVCLWDRGYVGIYNIEGKEIGKVSQKGISSESILCPWEISIDDAENLYICQFTEGIYVPDSLFSTAVKKFSPDGKLLGVFGSDVIKEDTLRQPSSVAVDNAGNIYVADSRNHRIVKFSPEGKFLFSFGKIGTNLGEFGQAPEWHGNPIPSICLDKNGNIIAADYFNHRIQIFNSEGNFLSEIKQQKSFTAKPLSPVFVYVDPTSKDSDIYVGDENTKSILKFNREGKVTKTFGDQGNIPPLPLMRISGMAIDNEGNLWICDFIELKKVDKEGNLLGSWKGEDFGLSRVFFHGIAIEKDKIFVSTSIGCIIVLNKDGELILKIGELGTKQGNFYRPRGISIFGDKLYIADMGNNRIQVFKIFTK